ncbi:MFS general substrate transporter [Astrocystis sublimbata]|nr:MFS general substrate transporter [Astrocystis sublimbata]
MAKTEKPDVDTAEAAISGEKACPATLEPGQERSVGYDEYREALRLEVSDKELRKVRLKIDLVIMPIFLITQALQFLDKTALNYANLFNYQQALGLHGNQFNYLSAIVYAGYFFGQYPCGWLVGRFPAQKVLAIAIFAWGVFVVLLTQCRDYSSAMAVRFLMGLFESAVTPGLTLMTGFWYTRQEIPLRQNIWFSALGWAGIIGSFISLGIANLPADTKPERWAIIFYLLGGVTLLWSFVVWFVLADSPINAKFLSHRERLIAVKRVSENETGIKNGEFNKKQMWLGFTDPKSILLFIAVFAAAIPNGVVNSFSTLIIADLGFNTKQITALKAVGDATQVISVLIAGVIILNVKNSRLIVATLFNVLCVVAAATLGWLPRSNTWGRLVSFWLMNSQSVGFTAALTTVSSNMAGYTHRSLASALLFTAYCWGNFAGPFVVEPSEAPDYPSATIGLFVGYTIRAACLFVLLIHMFFANRLRDKKYGPQDKKASDEAGMSDMTEFENKNFRYVL